jgi:hypothetical protein
MERKKGNKMLGRALTFVSHIQAFKTLIAKEEKLVFYL